MLGKTLAKILMYRLSNYDKIKAEKLQRKECKNKHKKSMIKLFGKTRYYLAYWFGQWVYFAWNIRDYQDILYQKFYTDETIALRYAERLKKKYTKVQIEKVYNKHTQIGFMLYGKGKKIEVPKPQPSNVIQLSQYKAVK